MTGLIARAAVCAVAGFVIIGPLASLGVWSLAERWTAASPFPQRFGLKYWSRMLTGDFLEPLRLGVMIAVAVTALALVLAVPLGYALARLRVPGRAMVLLAFLMPQAFPQLPVFASAILVFLYSLDEFTGTLLIGAPFVTTLPVYMYTASQGYELQIASVTALVLMAPGALLLLLLERFLKSEYLVFFGQL